MPNIKKSKNYFIAISLAIAFVLTGPTARADKITPSNRVRVQNINAQ